MHIRLNQKELDALEGLPHLARCLYILAIKPRMNWQTLVAGENPKISWSGLAEWLYVEPHSGIESGSPSRSKLRRSLEWLAKAGLIVKQSKDRQLVFYCPLAKEDKFTQKQADTKPTEEVAQNNSPSNPDISSLSEVKENISDAEKIKHADTHLIELVSEDNTTFQDLNSTLEGELINQSPEVVDDWVRIFTSLFEFPKASVLTIKVLALFQHWCDNKVALETVQNAVKAADQLLGEKPKSPVFYQNYVRRLLQTQSELNDKKQSNYERSQNDYRSRKPRTPTEIMWAACQSGLEGTDFDPSFDACH